MAELLHVHDDVGYGVPHGDGPTIDNLGVLGLHVLTEPFEEPLVTLNFSLVFMLNAEMDWHGDVEELLFLYSSWFIPSKSEVVNREIVDFKSVGLVFFESIQKFRKLHHSGKSMDDVVCSINSVLFVHCILVYEPQVSENVLGLVCAWRSFYCPKPFGLKFIVDACFFTLH